MNRTIIAVTLLAGVPAALAQSNVAPTHKFSWQENTGWMNWRDAGSPAGTQGVRVNATFLQGLAWGENIGYINFGDGTPGGGTSYTNGSGADHGVNILGNGDLAGFAWGENVGWINFGTAAFVPAPERARFDAAARRLRGYAWAENIGWLNLDDGTQFIGLACYPDCNESGTLTVADFTCFQAKFVAGDPYADCNATGTLTIADFTCFQAKFVTGCP